ncbi:MAG: cytochrome oxidase subunit III, partial [Candidatus Dadabacteria bacterium]
MGKKDELLDHNYDGIQEYDNDLPKWWVHLFWLTIIFSVGYVVYRHFGFAPSVDEELKAELAQLEQLKKKSAPAAPQKRSEQYLLSLASDREVIQKGREIFLGKCSPCHGKEGQGG